jgi:hypothetical protein
MARPATATNDVWTCDFLHDRTVTGGSLKWLSVVDEYTRELLVLLPAATLGAAEVRRVLGRLVGRRGRPRALRCDNGGEFIGAALAGWLPTIGAQLLPVAPASPWQNGFVESFHSRLRDEFLNCSVFADVADAKAQAEWFKREYNTVRPHSGLDYRTPQEFAASCGAAGHDGSAGGNPPERSAARGPRLSFEVDQTSGRRTTHTHVHTSAAESRTVIQDWDEATQRANLYTLSPFDWRADSPSLSALASKRTNRLPLAMIDAH